MVEKSREEKSPVGRPKGPPKRSRVVRLARDLDESLDIYSRVHKVPVSTIVESLVQAWATENRSVIEQGRDLFEGASARRRRRP